MIPPLRRLFLRFCPVLLCLSVLAGCIALPGGTADPEAATPGAALATEAIAVTPLEAAPAPAAPAPAAAAEGDGTMPKAATPEPPAAAEAEAEAEGAAAEAAPPPPPKPPEQIACEKKGGTWASAGSSGARACVRRMRDGGKQCLNGRQCEGDCLARSRTCSPIAPLFGCNEILQDNGARVTQCLE